MKTIVVLNDSDNVATCLIDLEPQATVEVLLDGGPTSITVRDTIAFGHKIAIRPMQLGTKVLKYGEVIGRASQPIAPGEWVHIHNVESARARGDME
jgi:altronate dehydratase small subunit